MKLCRTNIVHGSRFVLLTGLFAVVSSPMIGCQSTRSWSPVSWYTNRQPDAAKIAGRTNDASAVPGSPALSHTPTALASNSSPGSKASPTTPGATSSLPYGNAAAGGAPAPTGGLAAQANGFRTVNNSTPGNPPAGGYQTGPYGMSSASANAPTNFPNPYGGTYSTANTQSASVPGSSAATYPEAASLASSPSAANVMAGYGTPAGYGSTVNSPADSQSDYPSLPAIPVSGPSSSPPTYASSEIPNAPPAYGAVPNYGLPDQADPYGGYNGQGSTPGASAYQPVQQAGNFAPGTTGRSTTYNFGAGAASDPGVSGTIPAPSGGLPPNTAYGNSPLLR